MVRGTFYAIVPLLVLVSILAINAMAQAGENPVIEDISPSPAVLGDTITFVGSYEANDRVEDYRWESSIDGIFFEAHYEDTFNGVIEAAALTSGTHYITLFVHESTPMVDIWFASESVMLEVSGHLLGPPNWTVGDCWRWEVVAIYYSGDSDTAWFIEEVTDEDAIREGMECYEVTLTIAASRDDKETAKAWIAKDNMTMVDWKTSDDDRPMGAVAFLETIGFPFDTGGNSPLWACKRTDDIVISDRTYECFELSSKGITFNITYSNGLHHLVSMDSLYAGTRTMMTMDVAMDKEAAYDLSFLPEEDPNGDDDNNDGSTFGPEGLSSMLIGVVIIVIISIFVFAVIRRRQVTPTVPEGEPSPLNGTEPSGSDPLSEGHPQKGSNQNPMDSDEHTPPDV
jgi:hypothetical protein